MATDPSTPISLAATSVVTSTWESCLALSPTSIADEDEVCAFPPPETPALQSPTEQPWTNEEDVVRTEVPESEDESADVKSESENEGPSVGIKSEEESGPSVGIKSEEESGS